MSVLRKIIQPLLVLLLVASSSFLSAQTTREYQIKAAFLFNFAQFVEFPASAFSSAQAPLVIGVLGKNPFGTYLQQTVSGETVNGHPLVVQYYSTAEEAKAAHILFINISDVAKMEQAITALKGENILTVSDSPDFLTKGGMVRFYTKNNKTQLQINLQSTKSDNLVVSSKLLRLAEIYGPQ